MLKIRKNIDFIKYHKIAAIVSSFAVIVSFLILFINGLNLGIDFKGGILLEIETKQNTQMADLRQVIAESYEGDVALQLFGADNIVLLRAEKKQENDAQKAVQLLKDILEPYVKEFRRTETVGPVVGDELKEAAFYAITLALIAILVYIWFRFEWQFGIGAIIALMHDVFLTVGLFALFSLEFNLATVAAVLTIAGYSINDTVVIYDRLRENMRKYKHKKLEDLFNMSLNHTLSRTILTSLTTLLAIAALVLGGGQVIRDFSIALLWGVLIGTYSSIFIAVPFLLLIRPNAEDLAESVENENGE